MLPILFDLVFYAGLVSMAAAGGTLLLTARLNRTGHAVMDQVGGAAALLAGLAAANVCLHFTPFLPEAPRHWTLPLVLLAGLAGIITRLAVVPTMVRWIVALGVAAAAAWLLIPRNPDVEARRQLWLLIVTGTVLLGWMVPDLRAERQSGWIYPALLAVVAAGASVVLECAGHMQLTQFVFALGGAVAAAAVTAFFRPQLNPARGMAPGFAIGLAGPLYNGYFLSSSEVPLVSYLLVLVAPVAGALVAVLPAGSMSRRGRLALQVTAMLLPLVAAVALAVTRSVDLSPG